MEGGQSAREWSVKNVELRVCAAQSSLLPPFFARLAPLALA